MCEANVYLTSGAPGEEPELFLAAVDEIDPEGDGTWRLKSIFGEQKILRGSIVSMKLVDHRIIFAPSPAESALERPLAAKGAEGPAGPLP
jgi:predicted RNA-binding protein